MQKTTGLAGRLLVFAALMLINLQAAIGQATTTTKDLRTQIYNTLPTNTTRAITAERLRAVLLSSANAIDSIYTTLSLASSIGEYDASTGVATITATKQTTVPDTIPLFTDGQFFDVIKPGTRSITGSPVLMAAGGRIIVRGHVWAYIPPSDLALTKALAIEGKLPSKNYHNPATDLDDLVLPTNAGQPVTNSAYTLVDFIQCSPGEQWTFFDGTDGTRRLHLYNASKVYVSHIDALTKYITIPQGVFWFRASIMKARKATMQIERSPSETPFVPFGYSEAKNIVTPATTIRQDATNRFVSDSEKAAWNAKVGGTDVVSAVSKNLFDPSAATDEVILGTGTGNTSANSTYFTSGFINCSAGQVVSIFDQTAGARRITFYSSSNAYLGSFIDVADTRTFTVPASPAGIAKFRYSGAMSGKPTAQVELAPAPTTYAPFGIKLKSVLGAEVKPPVISELVQDSTHRFVKDSERALWNAKAGTSANIVLPKKLYAIVGKEFNLYYDAFTLLPEYGAGQPNFLFDIVCSKGAIGYRSFRFTPVSGDVGSYAFTFNLLDAKGNILQTATSTLVVVAASNPSTVKHILDFGDSTVDEGTTTKTVQENLAAIGGNVPLFYGQHHPAPYKNEARTGRTFAAFAGVGTTAYKVHLSGLNPAMDVSNIRFAIYSSGSSSNLILLSERWKVNPDGTGWAIGYYFSTFTPPSTFPATLNAAGTGSSSAVANGFPATLTVTNVETLPNFSIFKDNEGVGSLNISYYRQTVLGMPAATKFDLVRIDLGINDVGSSVQSDASITAMANNAKSLIAAFLADNAACKIIISLPKSRSSDYFVTSRKQSNFRISIHKLRRKLLDEFDENPAYPNVLISQSGYGIDRFYGYPNVSVQPAARITTPTFIGITDDVHPNTGGYQQVADALTGCILHALF